MPISSVLTALSPGDKIGGKNLISCITEIAVRTYDLGFTAFGGPPVHFTILRKRFVRADNENPATSTHKWLDQQTFAELFAICQALPGPASTQLLFVICYIHAGFFPSMVAFLIWSLPGAIGMYALSLGVGRIGSTLPGVVYALLSGLNASTVGVVALAAVQLAEKACVDKMARILVIFGACAGLCYNSLWYFPILIVVGGLACAAWDIWARQKTTKLRLWVRRKRRGRIEADNLEDRADDIELTTPAKASTATQRHSTTTPKTEAPGQATEVHGESERISQSPPTQHAASKTSSQSLKIGIGVAIILLTIAILAAFLIARAVTKPPPRLLSLFTNLYLAGTIIFGGGPVVIPLLREYVVSPGWVSSRDFLIGLAIIQAFPGPNFNFAVYLGALSLRGTGLPTVLGAILGYVAIFFPGLALTIGVVGMWNKLRSKAVVVSVLRGVNATAVGLVFTAVYRLWEIGYLTSEASAGQSLALEPWWVVVATLTYAECAWFGVPPAAAILLGAVLGIAWWGAVGR